MPYGSKTVERLFQIYPLKYRAQPYKLKSWTDTLTGYLNEADQLARCILRNRRYMAKEYDWAVAINIEESLPAGLVKEVWQKTARKLNARKVEALWVREPSWKNHVNYHLIVSSSHSFDELADAVEQSMPRRADIRWHKQVTPIRSVWSYARYIVKARLPGTSMADSSEIGLQRSD